MPEAEAALDGTSGRRGRAAAARGGRGRGAPISDVRASERYRRAMAAVIARRAIDAALTRARGGDRAGPAPAGARREGPRDADVNGIPYPVDVEPGTSLLVAVRERSV